MKKVKKSNFMHKKIEEYQSKTTFYKIIFLVKYIFSISFIFAILYVVGFIIWAFIPYKHYDDFLKERFMDQYVKNSEIVLREKNRHLLGFLSEEEERELLIKSNCKLKNFTFKKSQMKLNKATQESVEITASCGDGIYVTIRHDVVTGGEDGDYAGRTVNSYKEQTNCRFSFEEDVRFDDGFCWTRPKITISH